ncbi:hypothetical protein TIFTF001_016396 [Ficus carica]|uniref:Uncharacterized protein n=1 Tax=Ficus carica TaxID=3494 RepID=A0AA88A321_FICCA|nr:hypothetical protein TIFTF001_016396 [Ficus carica]
MKKATPGETHIGNGGKNYGMLEFLIKSKSIYGELSMRLVASKGARDDLVVFTMLSWSIWLDRNKFIFEGKQSSPNDSITRAGALLGDYLLYNGLKGSKVRASNSVVSSWSPPTDRFVKVNVDVSVKTYIGFIGINIVIRDGNGCKNVGGLWFPKLGDRVGCNQRCASSPIPVSACPKSFYYH